MGQNYSRFKVSIPQYYHKFDNQFTVDPDGVLNVYNGGKYKATNLLFMNSGYSKKYIFFRLSILLQVSPRVIFKPISLKQIKDKELFNQIKCFREFVVMRYV